LYKAGNITNQNISSFWRICATIVPLQRNSHKSDINQEQYTGYRNCSMCNSVVFLALLLSIYFTLLRD
jgi:hypothetical protein